MSVLDGPTRFLYKLALVIVNGTGGRFSGFSNVAIFFSMSCIVVHSS